MLHGTSPHCPRVLLHRSQDILGREPALCGAFRRTTAKRLRRRLLLLPLSFLVPSAASYHAQALKARHFGGTGYKLGFKPREPPLQFLRLGSTYKWFRYLQPLHERPHGRTDRLWSLIDGRRNGEATAQDRCSQPRKFTFQLRRISKPETLETTTHPNPKPQNPHGQNPEW